MPSALFTDLYELTMLQSYVREGLNEPAAFDLFVRRLRERNYLVACGLDDVLAYLENLSFTEEELAYLASLPQFRPDFVEWLAEFRFSGDVYAMREGTPFFPDEPIIEVVAPLPQAQLVETALLNLVSYPTNVASKASRIVHEARGRAIAEFGMRRLHGTDAAMTAARAAYVAGVESTSNVLAGLRLSMPVSGTMAHSYIQVYDSEVEAFRAFASLYPGTTLLVDTYDTIDAVRHAVALYHEMEPELRFGQVRLDSGDLALLSREVRSVLDDGGLHEVRIIASNSLDEYRIRDLVAAGAPIDAFGVGTRMGTVSDMPYIDSVYKLVEYAGQPRMKLSAAKSNYPGRKQVYRRSGSGDWTGDVIAAADEPSHGDPLLELVMKGGTRTDAGRRSLSEIRNYAAEMREALPGRLHALDPLSDPYPVEISRHLSQRTDTLESQLGNA